MKHGSMAWTGVDWKQMHRWWALNTVQPSGGLRGEGRGWSPRASLAKSCCRTERSCFMVLGVFSDCSRWQAF